MITLLQVSTVRWSPTGPGSANPSLPPLLCSASVDCTVRLWDTAQAACRALLHHDEQVYSLAFSPNGRFLATGSIGHVVRLWDVAGGVCVRVFQGHKALLQGSINNPEAGVFEVRGGAACICLFVHDGWVGQRAGTSRVVLAVHQVVRVRRWSGWRTSGRVSLLICARFKGDTLLLALPC